MTVKTYKKLSITLCLCFVLIAHFPSYTGKILHADDFSRIMDNSSLNKTYFKTLLFDNKSDGFYRPLNHLSFGLTYYLFGFHSLPYALFNLFLLLGCVWLLFHILNVLSQSIIFASLVTFGWLLNVKLIYPVLSWAVGRTTSMYTFFLLLSVYFTLKARKSHCIIWLILTILSLFFAMLTKESAIVGPVLILLLIYFEIIQKRSFKTKHLFWLSVIFILVYLGYFYLRSTSNAMTQETAPSFYKLDLSPKLIFRHLLAFIERSLIFSALLIPAFFLRKQSSGTQKRIIRKRPSWYWVVGIGFVLFNIAIAPMISVLNKSNLYAFFPSIFIVGIMVSLLTYSDRWPQRRRELKGILIMMLILGIIVTPIAWAKGKSVEKRAYIYNWSWSIYEYIKENRPSQIVLLYNPHTIKLRQVDFDYLTMGLYLLMKQPVAVLINPHNKDDKEWIFEIVPTMDSKKKGDIKPYIDTSEK